jgi:tetratricopeptide (TPR) repeat protein
MREPRSLPRESLLPDAWAACEEVLERFETAWRTGPPPAIDDYLPAGAEARGPLLIELVHIDLEFRLSAGEVARVEDYLSRYPQVAENSDAVCDLIVAEYRLRRRHQRDLTPAEYQRRFPHLGTDLAKLLAEVPGSTRLEAAPSDSAPPGEVTLIEETKLKPGQLPGWPTDLPDYHIVGELGKGGMGVVYKAVQLSLNRVVALKMIRAGAYASPDLLARFHLEAEALASLQHPNIVQVYEVGQHCGWPYMTMEFLEGGSLDDVLAGKPQPPRTSAELVETLARAMHCAHLRGIVHRDLKPANILLGKSEIRSPRSEIQNPKSKSAVSDFGSRISALLPKITDFGLAKRLEEQHGQTATGVIMGTPNYMAPEQAEGKARHVGPPADVYALGAILYEMLTGRPPFEGDTQLETIRKVVSEEPTMPTLLQPKVPRDLTTICLKCLEKLPARRYASAEALADDLRRYLNGEPILARRAGVAERAGKWMKRHPAGTALIGVILLAIIGVVGFGLWSYANVRRERDRALADYRVAFEAVNHLYAKMADERLLDEPNSDPLREELLQRAPEVFEGLARQHSTDPTIQREIGLAWFRLADIHRILEQPGDAEGEYLQAIDRQQALCREYPNKADYLSDLSASHSWLGELLRENQQRFRDAEPHFREALRLQEQARQLLHDDSPEKRRCLLELARAHYNLGIVQMDTARADAARADFDQAVDLLTALHHAQPRELNCRHDLARTLINRGILHKESGRPAEADNDYRVAIEHLRWLRGQKSARVDYRYDLAVALQNLGNLEESRKELEAARQTQQEALILLQELVQGFSSRPHYRKKLANTFISLGSDQARSGEPENARRSWEQAREILDALVKAYPASVDYEVLLGMAVGNLGWLKTGEGDWRQARPLLESAVEHLGAAQRSQLDRLDYRRALRDHTQTLAETLVQLKDHAAAVPMAEALAGIFPERALDAYYGACYLARCIPLARSDAELDAATRTNTAESYAGRAVALLRVAQTHAAQGLDLLPEEKEKQIFAALEGRTDFAEVMRQLKTAAQRPGKEAP